MRTTRNHGRLIRQATVLIIASTMAGTGWAQLVAPPSFRFERVGPAPFARPIITNVQVVDLDGDGSAELLACDAQTDAVYAYRRTADGQWTERTLGQDLEAPAHATVVDLDGDGDNDILVSLMGNVYPDDDLVGSLVLLDNDAGRYRRKTLLDDVRRVVDAQSGDFDKDGDLDLALAVFGYLRGQVLWLENRGHGRFRDHELLSAAGAIHVPIADYDRDGDLDIAAVISQEDEEAWAFVNDGKAAFSARRLWRTSNFDIGSAGLVAADLDADGDSDLLLPAGDNLEDSFSFPQPYHGCLWLENKGAWDFAAQRIATFPGAYAAAAGDLDADGDQDVALCSLVSNRDSPEAEALAWLKNDGQQRFELHPIARHPTALVTVACGDVTGDGRLDVVAGGLHMYPPFDRLGRISAWVNSAPSDASANPAPESAPALTAATERSPLPNLEILDPLTRADLVKLRDRLVAKKIDDASAAGDWLELGQAYAAYGFFSAGESCLAKAVRLDPQRSLAQFLRGFCLQRLGQLDDAIAQFERALPLADANQRAWLWYEIGRARLRQEDAAGAERAFVAAGENYAALAQLAKLRIADGRPQEALAPLAALSRAQPRTIEGFLLAARAADATGEAERAAEYRDHAEYNSRRLPAVLSATMMVNARNQYGADRLLTHARQFIAEKKYDQAVLLLEQVVDSQFRPDAVALLAGCEFNLKRPEIAVQLLEQLRQERGNFPQARVLLGDAYLATGQEDKALATWQATAGTRSSPALHQRLAKLYESRADHAAAQRQRALELAATGINLLRTAGPQQARKPLEQAVALEPDLTHAWFYLGEARRFLGDAPGARQAYETALEHKPNHGRAHAALARLPTR